MLELQVVSISGKLSSKICLPRSFYKWLTHREREESHFRSFRRIVRASCLANGHNWIGIATGYRLKGPGIEHRGKSFLNHPDQPWGPPRLLYNGYRLSFSGVKWRGRGVDNTPLSSAEVKERVELYDCFPSGPSWLMVGWTCIYIHLHLAARFAFDRRTIFLIYCIKSSTAVILVNKYFSRFSN